MTDTRSTLTILDAQNKIREIAKYGDIIPTYHYHDKGKNLRDYSLQDVRNILKNAQISEQPIFDTKYNNWKCRVEGQSIDGDDTVVITAIISHREVVAVTVFYEN